MHGTMKRRLGVVSTNYVDATLVVSPKVLLLLRIHRKHKTREHSQVVLMIVTMTSQSFGPTQGQNGVASSKAEDARQQPHCRQPSKRGR
mmetsp:Transcript_86251/g.247498  ORF Transcript_86251/g.247498 Transcript_86251/m.247498 type:complete len:89 (+) Transcript_86251:245-511(+)